MALGRGLESLIPKMNTPKEDSGDQLLKVISIDKIKPNSNQPRTDFDETRLQELANSIKNQGVIEPIIVKPDNNDYLIIAGERRWRAASLAGLEEIPVVINSKLNNEEILEIALIENIQREDLNILELARAYKLLLEKYDYTQDKLSEKLGVNRSSLTNTLRILKLPEEIQEMLLRNDISFGIAKVLMSLDNHQQQIELAKKVKEKELSVRETERLIKNIKSPSIKKKEKEPDPFIKDIEDKISRKIEAQVKIRKRKKAGKIEISFSSPDHLNMILNAIGIAEEVL